MVSSISAIFFVMATGGRKRKSDRELAKNLLDISASVKEAANGLLDDAGQKEDVGTDEESEVQAIHERADKLRKKAFGASSKGSSSGRKKTASNRVTSDPSRGQVMISVCRMKLNARGMYQKDGAFLECELDRSNTYDEVVDTISSNLNMDNFSVRLQLFRPKGGVIILPNEIMINKAFVTWTLGAYMRARHIGPDVIQLGIGPAQEVSIDKESFSLDVEYGRLNKNQKSVSLVDREARTNIPFIQPENHGYVVVYIAEDGVPLYKVPTSVVSLTSQVVLMARGYSEGNRLTVIYQSPEVITTGGEEVAMYCVVNLLSLATQYKWHAPTDMPSTPVIYATKPGIYFCTVQYRSYEVRSRPSELSVQPRSQRSKLSVQPAEPQLSISSDTSIISVPDTVGEKAVSCPSGILFPLSEIMHATGNRNEENLLGRGGYGSVYKGFLRHTVVAVKFLNEEGVSSLGADMLKNELASLTKFRHPNIVSVMGYSTNQDVVVYEYVSGGSLYDRLHEVTHGDDVLKWKDRLNILKDTCRGLVYLHAGIVHQDIKSQNILIDASNSAKLTDFGFAITLPDVREGRSLYTAKAFARSEGYYPSELTSGKFSAKSDMYSYGVVVLETFTAQKVFDSKRSDPKLVDHLEDELKTVTAFKQCQDCKAAECDEQWVTFLHKVVTETLARHSKRPTSLQVMESWESVQIT